MGVGSAPMYEFPVYGRVRAAVTEATQPLLVTVPNVEVLEVGEDWHTSTGDYTFTLEDLQSAIAAADDPAIRTPVIKFGHTDTRFSGDGDFAVGRLTNLHLSENGQTLLGDYVGVPLWLAKVMSSAYPRRSIEGEWAGMISGERKWDGFYLTAVALLGAYYPAIGTLEDLETFWSGGEPPMYDAETGEVVGFTEAIKVAASRAEEASVAGVKNGRRAGRRSEVNVAAAAQVEDVRRSYYESLESDQYWWWIRAMYVDPQELIVDDDEGHLYRVPYTVTGDEVTFAEPEEVRIEYVNVAAVRASVRTHQDMVAEFERTLEQANTAAVRAGTATDPPGGTVPPETSLLEGDTTMLTDENLRALGLEPGATQDEINEALAARLAAGSTPPPEGEDGGETTETSPLEGTPGTDPAADPGVTGAPAPAPATPTTTTTATVPDGMVLIDAETLAGLQSGVQVAQQIAAREATRERDALLSAAVKAGKFPRSRRPHYEALLSADPEGTRALIDSLAVGVVPVEEVGIQGGDAPTADTSYPEGWAPTVAAARKGLGTRVKVVGD